MGSGGGAPSVVLPSLLARRRPPAWAVGATLALPAFVAAPIVLSPSDEPIVPGEPTDLDTGRVYTVPADGGEPSVLVEPPGRYADCAWSPDGSAVAVAGSPAHGFGGALLLLGVIAYFAISAVLQVTATTG